MQSYITAVLQANVNLPQNHPMGQGDKMACMACNKRSVWSGEKKDDDAAHNHALRDFVDGGPN
jgi:hypothetical protein